MPLVHFVVFIAVSLLVFIALLAVVLRRRQQRPGGLLLAGVSAVVVVGGMLFARYGARLDLPVAVYYGLPALNTLLLPPLVFRMSRGEALRYVVLAWLSSPAIHLVFSLLFGWHEYLPFWHVPAWWELG
jgi:hypothetical protein